MRQKLPLVSIVVPTFHRDDDVLRLIESIKDADYPAESIELIFVDNGSDPALQTKIRSARPTAKIIDPQENIFSNGARRLGSEAAKGKYIFLLDDDNTLEKSCLNELVKAMEADSQLGAVGPIMLNGDSEIIWSAGGRLSSFGTPEYLYGGAKLADVTFPELITGVEYFPNACFVRDKALQSAPLDDAMFPHNWAETDFCLRIIQAGYKLATVPAAIERHHIGYTGRLTRIGPEKTYDQTKSRLLFRRRHLPGFANWVKFWAIIFPVSTVFYFLKIIQASDDKVRTTRAYFLGTKDGLADPMNNLESNSTKG